MLRAPRLAASPSDCLQVWSALVERETRIVEHFVVDGRSYLVLEPRERGRHETLSARNRAMLERVLLGASAKAVAMDFGLSSSAVATVLKRALRALGLHVLPSLVPPSLAVLVRAALGGDPEIPVRAERGRLSFGDKDYEVVSAPLPAFAELLSPAIADVLTLRAQGRTYAEIAARRGTSARTVANQITIAFRRLRVSRRADLFCPLELGLRVS